METVCDQILFCANAHGKVINPFVLPPMTFAQIMSTFAEIQFRIKLPKKGWHAIKQSKQPANLLTTYW